MKERVKTDATILSMIIIVTGFLFIFPGLFANSITLDNILDFLGLALILDGNFSRMIARGHKKAFSKKSKELVTTGIYQYTRNPMYLGSFMIGAGFVLIAWPWWALPLFALLFHLRFNKQMVHEETLLTKNFGKEYEIYCKKVPRLFPDWVKMKKARVKQFLNLNEAFSTKEVRGLWTWPLLAIVLETLQDGVVFKSYAIDTTLIIFMSAYVCYWVAFFIWYDMRR